MHYDKIVNVRVPQKEYEKMLHDARKSGKSVSEYVRALIRKSIKKG